MPSHASLFADILLMVKRCIVQVHVSQYEKLSSFQKKQVSLPALWQNNYSGPESRQEALQIQRDHATCHKYKISHLKRLAIVE